MDKKYHLTRQPIPAGFRIYEEAIAIPGVRHYLDDAREFCGARNQTMAFELETENAHDKSAIAIIGSWRGLFGKKSKKLGYVPRDIAARLAAEKLAKSVRPRLLKTYIGTEGFVEIEFQIIGPAEQYSVYKPISDEDPFAQVKFATANGDFETAMNILADLIAATEADSGQSKRGVEPLPYLEAAKLLAKMGLHDDELAILERYNAQLKADSSLMTVLFERLVDARQRHASSRQRRIS